MSTEKKNVAPAWQAVVSQLETMQARGILDSADLPNLNAARHKLKTALSN